MPPRRSHKKSKAGCLRCKQRKIKCDEIHPTCGNCSKHGVSCDFENPGTPVSDTPPSFRRQSTLESSGHVSSASSPSTNSTLMPLYQTPTEIIRAHQHAGASRSFELKLMHHYTALTSQTFSNAEDQMMAWQVAIPAIAYDAQYLMDAILAVSALHLRSLTPNDKTLIRASHGYMASSLAQYSSLLNGGVSQYNAEALFSTAALIAFQSSASRRFEDESGQYTLPLAWFHSFQGVKTVVMSSWQWLRNSQRVFPIINGQPPLALNFDAGKTTFFAPLLEGLDEQLETLPEISRGDTKQAYEHAVAFLNWAHKKPERSRTLGFAATVSRRFVELIGLQDPRTLVIIACFFAMTKVVDDVWWLEGVAKKEVNGIFSLLPPEWYDKMEWPLKIANWQGEVDEETWGYSPDGKEKDVWEEGSVTGHIDMLTRIIDESVPIVPPD